jgi:hypothetical protein
MAVSGEKQLTEFLSRCPVYIWLDVEKAEGKVITVEHSDYRSGIRDLGIIMVPHTADFYYEISRGSSIIRRMMNRYKSKKNKDIDA